MERVKHDTLSRLRFRHFELLLFVFLFCGVLVFGMGCMHDFAEVVQSLGRFVEKRDGVL